MQPQDLVAEVFVPHAGTDGQFGEIATGYPVARDLILTVRHVLYPATARRDDNRPIEVRWRARAIAFEWHRVSAIAWEDAHWDLALLTCALPEAVRPPPLVLSVRRPPATGKWYGVGFPAVGGKRDGVRSPFPMGGDIKPMIDALDAPAFHVDEDSGPPHPDDWKGASGSPVFLGENDQVVGIVLEVPGGVGAKRLSAAPVWRLLEDCAEFADKIGYREQKERLAQAEARLIARLGAADASRLRRALSDRMGCPQENPSALAGALLHAPLEGSLEGLHAALQGRSAAEWPAARELIADILGELLPAVYDPHTVAALARHAAEPEVFCLDVPAGLDSAAEVIMAGLRARPVYFRDLPDRNSLPRPRDLLETPPEAGFDEHGTALIANVERDLALRLGLDAEERLVATQEDRADMRQLVREELDRRASRRRQFFYLLLEPDAGALSEGAQAGLRTLKRHFDKLDFGVLSLRRSIRARGRERKRLSLLLELLPSTEDPAQ